MPSARPRSFVVSVLPVEGIYNGNIWHIHIGKLGDNLMSSNSSILSPSSLIFHILGEEGLRVASSTLFSKFSSFSSNIYINLNR